MRVRPSVFCEPNAADVVDREVNVVRAVNANCDKPHTCVSIHVNPRDEGVRRRHKFAHHRLDNTAGPLREGDGHLVDSAP
jgi:hypothetical protein